MTAPPRTLQERQLLEDEGFSELSAKIGQLKVPSEHILQERLRAEAFAHYKAAMAYGDCVLAGETLADMIEAAAALDAQSQLLAEAREALEPFARIADQHIAASDSYCVSVFLSDLRQARAILAKLKAATE